MPRLCRGTFSTSLVDAGRIFCFIDRLRVSLRKGVKENRVTAILLTAFFRLLDDIFLLLLLLSYHSSEICREELVNQLSLLRTVVTEKEIRLPIVWLFFETGGMQLSLGTFFAFFPNWMRDETKWTRFYYITFFVVFMNADMICFVCRTEALERFPVGSYPGRNLYWNRDRRSTSPSRSNGSFYPLPFHWSCRSSKLSNYFLLFAGLLWAHVWYSHPTLSWLQRVSFSPSFQIPAGRLECATESNCPDFLFSRLNVFLFHFNAAHFLCPL